MTRALLVMMVSLPWLLTACSEDSKPAPTDLSSSRERRVDAKPPVEASAADRTLGDQGTVLTSCDGGGKCYPTAPSTWTGPVILYQGTTAAPACPAAMTQVALKANADLSTPELPQCGCTCELKGSCKGSYTLTNHKGTGCSAACSGGSSGLAFGTCYPFIPGKCSTADTSPIVAWDVAITPDTSALTCKAVQAPTQPPAAPSWGVTLQACGTLSPSTTGCAVGICVPPPAAPYLTSACVFKAGDQQCPGAPYTKRVLAYGGYDDTRSCSTCACGAPSGASCTGNLSLMSGVGCTGSSLGGGQAPGCVALPNGVGGYFALSVTAKATCAQTGGQPTGGVTPKDPTTICCVE